jgi:hypothetical protein
VLQRPVEPGQYTSIRYSERLLDAGVLASIGTVGGSYDNAQAESLIGLYKTECTKYEGPWRGVDDLELATLSWVHWFNETRLHSAIGDVPPLEYETSYYGHTTSQPQQRPGELSLHYCRGASDRAGQGCAVVGGSQAALVKGQHCDEGDGEYVRVSLADLFGTFWAEGHVRRGERVPVGPVIAMGSSDDVRREHLGWVEQ